MAPTILFLALCLAPAAYVSQYLSFAAIYDFIVRLASWTFFWMLILYGFANLVDRFSKESCETAVAELPPVSEPQSGDGVRKHSDPFATFALQSCTAVVQETHQRYGYSFVRDCTEQYSLENLGPNDLLISSPLGRALNRRILELKTSPHPEPPVYSPPEYVTRERPLMKLSDYLPYSFTAAVPSASPEKTEGNSSKEKAHRIPSIVVSPPEDEKVRGVFPAISKETPEVAVENSTGVNVETTIENIITRNTQARNHDCEGYLDNVEMAEAPPLDIEDVFPKNNKEKCQGATPPPRAAGSNTNIISDEKDILEFFIKSAHTRLPKGFRYIDRPLQAKGRGSVKHLTHAAMCMSRAHWDRLAHSWNYGPSSKRRGTPVRKNLRLKNIGYTHLLWKYQQKEKPMDGGERGIEYTFIPHT